MSRNALRGVRRKSPPAMRRKGDADREMKYIASCSFGKDSLAAIIVSEMNGIHINEAIYCRIMFDDKISAELPEHEEFIYQTAIPMLEKQFGIKTTIVQAKETYCSRFYTKYQRGGKVGQIYGFPMRRGAWCNSHLKIRPIDRWKKTAGEYTQVVGIAADEKDRIDRKTVTGKYLPLVEYGVSEAEAFDICRKNGLLSPAYNGGRERLGCWFCHNQRIRELQQLRKEHPDLWERLMELDAISPCRFTQRETLHDFDNRFSLEDAQLSLF